MTPPQQSLEEASSHPHIYPEFHFPTPAGSEMNPEPQGIKESRQLMLTQDLREQMPKVPQPTMTSHS